MSLLKKILSMLDPKLSCLVVFSSAALYYVDYTLSMGLSGNVDMHVYQNAGVASGIKMTSSILWLIRFAFLFSMFIWLNIYYSIAKNTAAPFYLFLMLTGGISNDISILVHGVVFDYISIADFGSGSRLAFNIADILVTLGTIGYIYEMLKMMFRMRG